MACAGSCGPGSLHFINGLYEANRNRAPVVLIATQIVRQDIGFSSVQEVDLIGEALVVPLGESNAATGWLGVILRSDAPPFDAVLLDAPCSATGTIRRHPDVAWTKKPGDIDALALLQTKPQWPKLSPLKYQRNDAFKPFTYFYLGTQNGIR